MLGDELGEDGEAGGDHGEGGEAVVREGGGGDLVGVVAEEGIVGGEDGGVVSLGGGCEGGEEEEGEGEGEGEGEREAEGEHAGRGFEGWW